MVERFWDIIEDININKVLLFLRDNIVGTVILVTAIIWIPVSCVISYFDRRKMREDDKHYIWNRKEDLIHPSQPRRVITTRLVFKIFILMKQLRVYHFNDKPTLLYYPDVGTIVFTFLKLACCY